MVKMSLEGLEKKVLEEILKSKKTKNPIKEISYKKPKKQLGDIVKNVEYPLLLKAFRVLEEAGALILRPKRVLFFDFSKYEVNLGKAISLYNARYKKH